MHYILKRGSGPLYSLASYALNSVKWTQTGKATVCISNIQVGQCEKKNCQPVYWTERATTTAAHARWDVSPA